MSKLILFVRNRPKWFLYDGISSNNYDKIQRSEDQQIVVGQKKKVNRLTAFNVKEPRHYLEIVFIIKALHIHTSGFAHPPTTPTTFC